MLFKELDKQTKAIFRQYKMESFKRYTLGEDADESHFIETVDFAMSQLDEDLVNLLRNEYLDTNGKNWWVLYYSRTTYYRLKRKAMEELLVYLK